jgi:hypothetical protein
VLEFIRLQDPDLATIISAWEPHGKGFQVHDPKNAEVEILPIFSIRAGTLHFIVNSICGASRVLLDQRNNKKEVVIIKQEDENKNISSNDSSFSYYHEMFHRSKAFLCQSIRRRIRRRIRLPSFNLISAIERQQPEYHPRMASHHVPSSSTMISSTVPAVAKQDQE